MKPEVIGIGELLWDMLPSGRQMGGAPANFACHVRSLGVGSAVISRVGDDAEGKDIVEQLAKKGVSVAGIPTDPDHPTGTVDVSVSDGGQPEYSIKEDRAWDHLDVSPAVMDMAGKAAAVCFGTLGQRSEPSRTAIRNVLKNTPPNSLRVLDVNLRQQYFSEALVHESLMLANVAKINDEELHVLADMFDITEKTATGQLQELLRRYDLRLIACTCGGDGSILCDPESVHTHPGVETKIVDTIGAGDSFTAAITVGLLGGHSLERISDAANRIAAYVCASTGATPSLPPELETIYSR